MCEIARLVWFRFIIVKYLCFCFLILRDSIVNQCPHFLAKQKIQCLPRAKEIAVPKMT